MTERETAPPSTEPTADAEAVEPMGEIGTPLPRPTVPRPTPEQPATGNPALEPATDEPWVTGQWYVALPSAALRPGRMLARILFGQPVLLARRRDGSVFALRDLCPHRGIPLSAGRFDGETVACGYHGWRFDGEGRCTLIPSLAEQSQVDTGRVRTGAWRVVERQGLIWIWLPDPAHAADAAPPPPAPLPDVGEAAPRAAVQLLYETDIDNAAFGMVDPAHIPFVHSAWWLRRSAEELRLKEKHFEPVEMAGRPGWTMTRHPIRRVTPFHRLLGRQVETEIALVLPGLRIERIIGERHTILNLLAITPIDAKNTTMTQAIWWSMPGLGWMAPAVRAAARRFLDQDGAIIRKQNVGLAFNPRQMLVADADQQMRWWLRLRNEWRAHRAESRPLQNPVTSRTLRFRS